MSTNHALERTGVAVQLRALSRSFVSRGAATVHALSDVDLDLPANSVTAVVGPSGSGKSTLLYVLGALLAPDSGEVAVGETAVQRLTGRSAVEYRRNIGFVFQRFHLLPALSAVENVISPVLPYRTRYDKRERALELLAAVDLADRATSLPAQLSGGQQQRVGVARALMNRPRLLLADEPTGNLDSANGTALLDLLLELRDQFGMTIVIATHDTAIAARCDRQVTMNDGRIVVQAA